MEVCPKMPDIISINQFIPNKSQSPDSEYQFKNVQKFTLVCFNKFQQDSITLRGAKVFYLPKK